MADGMPALTMTSELSGSGNAGRLPMAGACWRRWAASGSA
jgi:hypothetical protein